MADGERRGERDGQESSHRGSGDVEIRHQRGAVLGALRGCGASGRQRGGGLSYQELRPFTWETFTAPLQKCKPIWLRWRCRRLEFPIRISLRCGTKRLVPAGVWLFVKGYLSILSGMYDVVLVGGTERLRSIPGGAVQQAMATSMDIAERNVGLTFAAYWSYVAKAYARKHGLGDAKLQELLAKISIKNHYHGAFNKKAQFQKEITMEEVMGSTMVAPPIKIMDCCPFSDGAAALVLCSEETPRSAGIPSGS